MWLASVTTQEVFVPSSDHVRVVRMLIKHLHFFANSGKAAQPSPLDSLRKYVVYFVVPVCSVHSSLMFVKG